MTYQFTRSGADIETIHDDADAGNIGKSDPVSFSGDVDNLEGSGFYRLSGATNTPTSDAATLIVAAYASSGSATQIFQSVNNDEVYIRRRIGGTWQSWQEIYHTGNTSSVEFGLATASAPNESIIIGNSADQGVLYIKRATVSTSQTHQEFVNSNGTVGSISTSGTATAYNTTSDNALKDFLGKPTDEEINAKFSAIYDTFQLFNWKNGSNSEAVWGFGAWDVVDAGLDFGTDRQGPRDAEIGSVYQKAEFDEEGNEIKPELRVSPAGVDQSKVVPYLVAKIEQLERRIKQLEG